ncbi:aldo/keto reductase [Saccharomonospora iraqiensis]|uniref:aldo/keto reductase n=1 Tax=Saccharomonospora iraqiensis TaxID=52698 RepID=UPI00022E0072|nr:aldo/keto reductase [Saccharomonospora iraqiensis]
MAQVPTITLNTGAEMPRLGYGVFQVPADEVFEPTLEALRAGYRSIDTATIYGNEEGVGRAIAESGVPRQELFVTTKLWNDSQGYDNTLAAFDASLARLGLDYVDLYLIHWPMPGQDRYVDTWKAFEKLHAEGRARAIGVSNFHSTHLRRLFDETSVVPAVNQVELHPNLPQAELRAFHAEHGIVTEAWSPLGQGKGLLDEQVLVSLAEKHGKTPAQVVLRWHFELGNVTIPKSVTPSRIRSNLDIFDFALSEDDMSAIAALDTGTRVGPDPDAFGA